MVPAGEAYDPYRIDFLTSAAIRASDAAAEALPTRYSYSSGQSPNAAEAIRICNTLLALDPEDAGGYARTQLARALSCAGRHDEAARAAGAAIQAQARAGWSDPYACYRYAKMLSLSNNTEAAAAWLQAAFQRGADSVVLARNDADFAALRDQRPDQFRDITAVKIDWKVKYGIVQDDVIITNRSAFALTHVRFQVIFRKNGSDLHTDPDVLEFDRLEPGQSHLFESVVHLSGDSYEGERHGWATDQDEKK
jgi:tetratricopeptide (TPR) repeat protein